MSQRQDSLKIQLARFPSTPQPEETMELKDEVLSSVGAQDIVTSGYQVSSDLYDVEIYRKNHQKDVDAVIRLGF